MTRILFAVQGTGNGHLSRARDLLPHLQQHGEVDLLVSGTQVEVAIGQPIKFLKTGMGYVFGKQGGVDLWASLKALRPVQFICDMRQLPLDDYDVIINDFEPLTARAAKLRGRKIYGLSHQAAFLSDRSPRPTRRTDAFAEWLFKHYAPCEAHTAFHFKAYDDFITTPVIRDEIRALKPYENNHVTVYLPAYGDEQLIPHFQEVKGIDWHLFSKHSKTAYHAGNVWVRPIDNQAYLDSMVSCTGLLTGGGFEAPAEALYMGKKLFVVPMSNQYEQQCNAAALLQLGVPVCHQINTYFPDRLREWLKFDGPQAVDYPDQSAQLVARALAVAGSW